MALERLPLSRFAETPAVVFDGQETFGAWVRPDFLTNTDPADVITYVVPAHYEGLPHLLAEEFYGSYLYEWVLIAFNQPTEHLNWPRAGEIIRYPRSDVVFREVS